MTVSRNARLAGLVLGLGLASQAAVAADKGFYIGVDVGQSSNDVSQDELDAIALEAAASAGFGAVLSDSSLDDSDTAFGLVFGYRFNRNLAAELGYVDLGTASYVASAQVTSGLQTIPMDVGIDLTPKGPTLAAVGILPLNDRWSLDARVGAFFADLDLGVSAESGTTQESDSASDSSTAMIYGVGAEFAFSAAWSARADYRRYDGISDEINVDVISVGVRYSFQ